MPIHWLQLGSLGGQSLKVGFCSFLVIMCFSYFTFVLQIHEAAQLDYPELRKLPKYAVLAMGQTILIMHILDVLYSSG